MLRSLLPGYSWNKVRQLIGSRRVRIGDEVCLDPARRMKEGEIVEVLDRPAPKLHRDEAIKIRYLDEHIVVVEKPSGMCTVRHPSERDWPQRRKALSPALEDLLPRLILLQEGRKIKGKLPRLRIVHRLDKETSGLVVFARTPAAEVALGRQFRKHTVHRRYLAFVPGDVPSGEIATRLVRDRGDGRRGSTTLSDAGKLAVTHVVLMERLHGYTFVYCRLETGRTHQIRIHLAELGHPICGEKVYNHMFRGEVIEDRSDAPRLALHADELGFAHPISGEKLFWTMPLPADLTAFLERLRKKYSKRSKTPEA